MWETSGSRSMHKCVQMCKFVFKYATNVTIQIIRVSQKCLFSIWYNTTKTENSVSKVHLRQVLYAVDHYHYHMFISVFPI